MPAMIRLAAIAGNRNWMISQSIALLLPRLRKCRDQQIDVEVEELDVVLRAGLASNGRRHGQHRRYRLRSNLLGRLRIEVGSMMMTFTCCRFISGDEVDDVRRGGRHSSLGSTCPITFKPNRSVKFGHDR